MIQGYLQKRGQIDPSAVIQNSQLHTYNTQIHTKPSSSGSSSSKQPTRAPQEAAAPPVTQNPKSQPEVKAKSSNAKKKKGGKAISLAEAAKGSVVFKQGKPCACQARRYDSAIDTLLDLYRYVPIPHIHTESTNFNLCSTNMKTILQHDMT